MSASVMGDYSDFETSSKDSGKKKKNQEESRSENSNNSIF
jgi:hypothetical protein